MSSYSTDSPDDFNFYKKAIEEFNKQNEINLIVFDFSNLTNLTPNFENYLFNLNKKFLLFQIKILLLVNRLLLEVKLYLVRIFFI